MNWNIQCLCYFKNGTNRSIYFPEFNPANLRIFYIYSVSQVYTNGTTSLRIVLVKKVLQYNSQYYEDLIIGEYQYIENGVEKVNTLSEINIVYPNQIVHNIAGNSVLRNDNKPPCNDCEDFESRLRLSFTEPNSELYGTMIVKKTTQGSQEAIKIHIKATGSGSVWLEGTPPPPLDFNVPSGEYFLIKQP